MEQIVINTPGAVSNIFVGAAWETTWQHLPEDGVVIVTDNNVYDLYRGKFPGFPVLKIIPGEESKSLKVVEKLSDKLLKTGVGRSGFILAIGGGVVCDIAGFLASVFMRGIRCGYISTSLLSQVDASTGGKNGVNLGKIKNVIGNFRQPEFVICDTSMLKTLPEKEYLSGLAELIKTGLIGDPSIIASLENKYQEVISRNNEFLSDLVARAVRFKASIVSQDEKESGARRILNFGHTFGHAIELVESAKHGFAVASGMKLATLFSQEKGYISGAESSRIISLLEKYNLLGEYHLTVDKMRDLVIHDKKRSGTDIHFVFLESIGNGIVRKIPVDEVIEFYRHNNTDK
ncbi:MAG: 3-dehydroquinate synthase [Bacteroidia bacterium]|nr:3-dehydroquinate synthase [Bacteroidia bacterium]